MLRKSLVLSVLLLAFGFTHAVDLRGDTIDIRSYNLKLDLSDFTNKVLKADALIGIKARKNGVEGIHLDLLRLNVDSVKVNSFTTIFSYNDTVVDVNLLGTLGVNDSATVEIFYHGNPLHATGDFGGFYWTAATAFNIGVSFLANPHNYGRVWFPCFDNFEQRNTFEFYVTTKNTHKAFCNGLLLGVTTAGVKKTWHWKLNEAIPSYLASVAVADYATVSDTVNGINGTIPIQLAANATDTANLKNLFVHLHNAFHIFESLWGPYQWERVGYCIVPFDAGAMEHATNIGFMSYYLNVYASQAEVTMAHELSHHWFGDLVTCDSASEMWLNEGWARYNEYLFLEKLYGDSTYVQGIKENHEGVLHSAYVLDGSYLPVSGVPTQNTYGTTVYDKGADVIHTLRYYMGDSLFFHCVKNYVADFSWKNASTAQFRDYLSQCSGMNLNDYFNDWVYAPGFPHFAIERWTQTNNAQGSSNYFYVHQRLHHAPHYYQNVPLTISMFDSAFHRMDYTFQAGGPCNMVGLDGVFQPVYIAVDFDGKLQDAITDEWHIIHNTGTVDFGTAKMSMQVNANVDSSLVRVEHNWIRPEPTSNKIPGLHLHDKRYWTVDGIFNTGFSADATIAYDGHDISLDSTFFTNTEDSLVIMYRPNGDTGWVIASGYSINTQGSATDKAGSATIQNVKRGQYCLAIWNSAMADTTTIENECGVTALNEIKSKKDFQLFPNPAKESVTVTFEKNEFWTVELFDSNGRRFLQQKIDEGQSSANLKLKDFASGTYIVTLTGKNLDRISKKIIKQ